MKSFLAESSILSLKKLRNQLVERETSDQEIKLQELSLPLSPHLD